MLRLSDFDYNLPKELIAQYPLNKRDSARLLVLNRKKRTIEHRIFTDLADYLKKDDVIVLNDTKVLRARLIGQRPTGGKVEILLLNRIKGLTFSALIKPSRVKSGEKIILNGGDRFGIINAENEITFNARNADAVYSLGIMPLPPYIKREPQVQDFDYYQTVYAREEGAIASPTAGLHFTKELIEKIESGGTHISYITLHVGVATFKQVKVDDITEHRMEPEYFRVPEITAGYIDNASKGNSRIFAVGTTSLRALETSLGDKSEGFTDLFVYPGYKFNIVDCLLTNFHLPKTTLFMLVSAFGGKGLIKKAYQEAIDKEYRFYSYGDAMLII